MNYRNFNQDEKNEVMKLLLEAAQSKFRVSDVREADFTTGANLEIKTRVGYGMFREDSRIVADIFNSSQNKYKVTPYGQEGIYRFEIEKRR